MEILKTAKSALPFHVEIVGFSDEEGVRYQTAYLGSRAMAGTLTRNDLARVSEKGIERARRQRQEILGYAEVHIEQGPVLEARKLSVGVVSAISGQSRIAVEFAGRAGHAGTTPMNLRHDALCGAAELVLAAEKSGVTATVGELQVAPGASNVIPAHAALSLDVRHQKDARRLSACSALKRKAAEIARKRGLRVRWTLVQETATVPCDKKLTGRFRAAVARRESEVLALPSGAGHDAAAMSALCPVAMLFVRCKGGVSHHPAEAVASRDVAKAIEVLTDFLRSFSSVENSAGAAA
ncbi:MAG: allantoate deiminase [Chthoniobacter sp.]|nr:allantoate deiminase [Chthoniobacter sp.]